ncbi:hypothetical protein BJY52DRAFT_1186241 [Lactarius psammicola]|nr:hypothetical protein BJY52DRAFT_1186241 [Lactarius psammicola]
MSLQGNARQPGSNGSTDFSRFARILGRPSRHIAPGGVRGEAEIRYQHWTTVGSGPGLLAQTLRKAGRMDPVLLDEIDKVSRSNYHGDPSAALLEFLDLEKNAAFNPFFLLTRMADRMYLNVPIDLSLILFICTPNSLDTMTPLLLDCSTRAERLSEAHFQLTEPALPQAVIHYTREPGVRPLERAIGGILRFKAVEWAAHVAAQDLPPSSLLSPLQAASEASDALNKCGKNGDANYNPVVEAGGL